MPFIDGFEQFDKAENPAAEMRLADYTILGNVVTGTGRKGGRSLVCASSSVSRAWPWTGDRFSVGFAFQFDKRGALIQFNNGATLALSVSTGRPYFVGGAIGNAGPVKSRWYYCEVELRRNARQMIVWFNGRQDFVGTMPEELAAANVVTCRLNPWNAVTDDIGSTKNYDDFYMNDGARIQPMQIVTRFPTKDETPNEWAPSTSPTAAHWAMVGPLPTDKLDRYLIGNATGAEESFSSSQTLPDSNNVLALGLVSLVRKTTVDNLTLTMKFGGRNVPNTDIPMDWKYRYSDVPVQGDTSESILEEKFGAVLNRS
ncbi:hypothetical protein SOP91_00035 (plasmid) [Enterobacter hormaechei]|uniref:hypothetical protein n=1 Tax=Enterobacter hormaechei TaxID=158836 RepID=UPI002B4BCE57|nr:hypothetical protein [Enterobacter hormaechei]WRM07098.1 hypothetical protein SOP91_00035 [Enterobacter hormaechei]